MTHAKDHLLVSLAASGAGSLDLMTDEAFLEALLSFMSSIPTEDVWQVGGPCRREALLKRNWMCACMHESKVHRNEPP